MVRRTLMGLMALSLLASTAWAGIPDLTLSTAGTAAGARVSVYTLPSGGGHGLNDCYLSGGTKTDATITLTLVDSNGDGIYLYPACDMWLESSLGGLALCEGGSCADGGTDYDGVTTFSNPVFGGKQTTPGGGELCQVIINGSALAGPGMDIQFNSPDVNGDLIVNLTDVVLFAGDYYGAYAYRSDFYFDGTVNLSDIVLLAQGSGAACP
jgi:hypothetical protein